MARKKTRKKAAKKTHGGRRKGAGRPATGRVITKTKWVRCSEPVDAAINEYLDKFNGGRAKAGLSKISFARWATDVLLVAAGREDLTEAANPIR